MPSDNLVPEIIAQVKASALISVATWGAIGGATNAMVTRVSTRGALRLIILGGLIASGMGSLSIAILAWFFDIPIQAIPIGGGVGSAAYIVGVFGSAIIEVMLARIRTAQAASPNKED